ncbi:lipopolysaccharide biosynthesis protein [Flavobacterium croceum]|uniref:lipopolysaccharide biosynthesis protein n=1 Tax=Flavobacterium croceum TaxID=370975 RepID=UPI0024A86AA7|nr:oligosaccharide flippase family protein [Flavobacterium croceum]
MKFFSKDSLWILCSNVVKLIFGFLIVPIIGRSVLPEQLGKIDLLLAYGPFINQLISLGLTNSNTKFYKENEDINVIKYMQSKIWMRSVLFTTMFFIFFSLFSAKEIGLPILIIGLYSISILLENICFLPQNQLLNSNQFQQYSIYNTLSTIIRHSLTLLLVVVMTDKLLALSIGLLISNLYLFFVNIRIYKDLLFCFTSENLISEGLIQNIKKYSLPLFFLGSVGILYQSSDRLLLAYFTNDNMTQIGYLGMAQRIIGMLSVGLSGLFTVWGVKAFENYSDEILMKEKEKLIKMMLLVLITSLVGMFFLKTFIINFILTTSYADAFPICVLLIGIFVNNRIREILEKYFLRKGKSRFISALYVGFSVFSVIGSALFLYYFSLEEMLMFRLLVTFLHSVILFLILHINKQKINPVWLGFNFLMTIVVIISVKLQLF